MLLFSILLFNLLLITREENVGTGFCDITKIDCDESGVRLLFYDVNPPEGFNLRRDVYMRFAIMLSEARKRGEKKNWRLILPPWHGLYHWKHESYNSNPIPWSAFFDIESFKSYAPVSELYEVFNEINAKNLQIDVLYVLKNYPNAFEGGTFVEKWEIEKHDCVYDGQFWGYNNVTVKETVCVKFQGKISMLWDLISLHSVSNKKIMFAHGEIPLHDNYGTKTYWDCRRSMKFNNELVKTANEFILKNFDCDIDKCTTYISVHWRRQDFARSRRKDVPSIKGTVQQINEAIKKHNLSIGKVFIATDASQSESKQLEHLLNEYNYKVYFYSRSNVELEKYRDGHLAIIEQIICSHSSYFIGTHESTFSFRIQEEREILGFDSSTTFNRLCPDSGPCERPSKWTIVN